MTRILFDPEQFLPYAKENNIPQFRRKQIMQGVFKDAYTTIDQISTLPKDLREKLTADGFVISTLQKENIIDSTESTKFLFKLADWNLIETVVMYHWHQIWQHNQRKILRSWTWATITPETHKLNRITVCISSQVWCAVWCIFCVTGKLGFKKNLHRTEMIMQLLVVNEFIKERFGKKEDGTLHRLRNVVFMGMGEPLLNYDHMKISIQHMLDQQALWLSKRHITISTSWVASAIQKLVEEGIDVRLALSLHAPNQPLREELIPMIAKRWPLDELMKTIDTYTASTKNRIFYEYIMIKNKTDTALIAHQLGKLLKQRDAHVNLIPYNENPAMPELETSEYTTILAFKKIVADYGVTVTVRDTLWREVKWACGQLGYEKVQETMELQKNHDHHEQQK
jgi:23S rRNA (adenine2503-C2)-methyltransferase